MRWIRILLLLAIVWPLAVSCSSQREVSRASVINENSNFGVFRGLFLSDTTFIYDYLTPPLQAYSGSMTTQRSLSVDSIDNHDRLLTQPRAAIVRHAQLTDHFRANTKKVTTDSLHQQTINNKQGNTPSFWPAWLKYLFLALVTIAFSGLGFIFGFLFKALNNSF